MLVYSCYSIHAKLKLSLVAPSQDTYAETKHTCNIAEIHFIFECIHTSAPMPKDCQHSSASIQFNFVLVNYKTKYPSKQLLI